MESEVWRVRCVGVYCNCTIYVVFWFVLSYIITKFGLPIILVGARSSTMKAKQVESSSCIYHIFINSYYASFSVELAPLLRMCMGSVEESCLSDTRAVLVWLLSHVLSFNDCINYLRVCIALHAHWTS